MATELKAIQETAFTPAVCVTRFFNKCPKLQLTQGIGAATKGEAGFITVDRQQAIDLIAALANFIAEGNKR